MKRNFYLFLVFAAMIFSSCEKNNDTISQQANSATNKQNYQLPNLAGRETLCPEVSTQLTAGQFFNAGSVTVTSDANFIYVTYTTANGYVLTQTHLFDGIVMLYRLTVKATMLPANFLTNRYTTT